MKRFVRALIDTWSTLPVARLAIAMTMGLAAPATGQDAGVQTVQLADSMYMVAAPSGNIAVAIARRADSLIVVHDQGAVLADTIMAAVRQIGSGQARVFNTHWLEGRTSTLGANRIRVIAVPNAHSDRDAIVLFVRDSVVYMGDTFMRDRFPMIDTDAGGSIDGMIAAADTTLAVIGMRPFRVSASSATETRVRIIPGRGPLSTVEDLVAYRDALQTMRDSIAAMRERGMGLSGIRDARPFQAQAATWNENEEAERTFVSSVYSGVPPRGVNWGLVRLVLLAGVLLVLTVKFVRSRGQNAFDENCPGWHMADGVLVRCSGPQDQTPEPDGSAPGKPDRVVTLVHGTFARHASWLREGPLCEALQQRQDPSLTHVSRFCWSGANTHTARLEAGKHLAVHLRSLRERFPLADHFVAGHSHGGNVALYAMKDPDDGDEGTRPVLGDQMTGVITLATPFVALRERALPESIRTSISFIVVFASVIAVYSVLDPAGTLPEPQWQFFLLRERSNVVSLASLFVLWFFLTAFSAEMYRGRDFRFSTLFRLTLRKKNREERDQLLDEELKRLKPEGTVLDRLLVVRPLGDEASMGLVVSQFFSYVQNRILTALEGAQHFLLKGFSRRKKAKQEEKGQESETEPAKRSLAGGCLVGIVKLGVLIGLFFWLIGSGPLEQQLITDLFGWVVEFISEARGIDLDPNFTPGEPISREVIGLFVFLLVTMLPIVSLLAVYIVFSLASVIGLLGLLFAAIPFGLDAMFWNHFASTTAETSPLGTSPAEIFVADGETGEEQGGGLAHSGIYVDEGAIRQIVAWIQSRSATPAS